MPAWEHPNKQDIARAWVLLCRSAAVMEHFIKKPYMCSNELNAGGEQPLSGRRRRTLLAVAAPHRVAGARSEPSVAPPEVSGAAAYPSAPHAAFPGSGSRQDLLVRGSRGGSGRTRAAGCSSCSDTFNGAAALGLSVPTLVLLLAGQMPGKVGCSLLPTDGVGQLYQHSKEGLIPLPAERCPVSANRSRCC